MLINLYRLKKIQSEYILEKAKTIMKKNPSSTTREKKDITCSESLKKHKINCNQIIFNSGYVLHIKTNQQSVMTGNLISTIDVCGIHTSTSQCSFSSF